MNKKRLIVIVTAFVVIVAVLVGIFISIKSSTTAESITLEEAQRLVNETLDDESLTPTDPLKLIATKNSIKVNSVSYGDEKDVILECTVTTPAVYDSIAPYYNEFLSTETRKSNGMYKRSLDFKMEFDDRICQLIESAELKEYPCTVTFYEVDGERVLYAEAKVIDTVFGGAGKTVKEMLSFKTYKIEINGSYTEREINNENLNKGFAVCLEVTANAEKPDTSTPIIRVWNGFKSDFKKNFIDHDRWLVILKGLVTTLELTFFSLLIGIVIGFVVAFVRCTHDKLTKRNVFLRFFNKICSVYLTVIRGTPVLVQIMVIYFVIFMPIGFPKFWSAVICFGLNSGAYVAEIVRGGIMSVDDGQMEAGRSLGFNYIETMFHIVFPQAFKAVLPALANEFVVLLKETSVAFYIGLADLMYAGNSIRAATYSAFMPLITVAIIYLVMVMGLSKLVNILERRLRSNER